MISKRQSTTRIILLFVLVALGVIVGVAYFFPRTIAPEEKFGSSFNYYPKANVYYDVEKEQYYSLIDEKWAPNPTLAEEGATYLGKHVVIDSPSFPVWTDNEYHRLVYGTALYTTPNEFDRKYAEDSLRSVPKKVVPPKEDSLTVEVDDKKRSGVRNFFDKLFKKREKKKE